MKTPQFIPIEQLLCNMEITISRSQARRLLTLNDVRVDGQPVKVGDVVDVDKHENITIKERTFKI